MKAFYQDNKKAILTAAGVGAVAALLATIYTQRKNPHFNLSNRNAHGHKKNEHPTAADERRYVERQEKPILNTAMGVDELILSSIPVEYDNNILTLDTVNRINSTAADLAVNELIEANKQARLQRRNHADDLQKYVDSYYEHLQKIQEIGEKHRRDVLKQLNLTEEALQNALTHHALNAEHFVNILHEKLNSNLIAAKDLSASQLEGILNDEWDALREASNTHLAQIKKLVKKGEDAAKIALIKAHDAVFAKHDIEEEDLRTAKTNHADASNLRTLLSTTRDEQQRLHEL